MRKSILLWSFTVLSVLLVCSCKDDDEVVLSSDCYISSFTLGNVKRMITTVNTAGRDTSYMISYSASYFPMTVNQLDGTIANKDSLPINSKVNAVLASVEASGTVVYRKPGDGDDAWRTYSASDSIDFTTPLIFRVYSPDYTASRDYALQVNVHRQDGDVFTWKKVTDPVMWSDADTLKTRIWNGCLWLYARINGNTRLFTADLPGGDNWVEQPVTGLEKADVTTLTEFKGHLYMSGADGMLIRSEDGKAWDTVATGRDVHLLAADRISLYALSDGRMWRSVDGLVWEEEDLDDVSALLPMRDFSAVSYTQENGLNRILLVGNRNVDMYPSDKAAMVWSHSMTAEQEMARWTCFNVSPDNRYACPRLHSLNIVRYDDVLLALGRASLGGTIYQAFDNLYVSHDNGITWKTDEVYVLPGELKGQDVAMSAAVDNEYRLWIVTEKQIWQGRLNRLGFGIR